MIKSPVFESPLPRIQQRGLRHAVIAQKYILHLHHHTATLRHTCRILSPFCHVWCAIGDWLATRTIREIIGEGIVIARRDVTTVCIFQPVWHKLCIWFDISPLLAFPLVFYRNLHHCALTHCNAYNIHQLWESRTQSWIRLIRNRSLMRMGHCKAHVTHKPTFLRNTTF